jgi:hypothetical protein
LLSTLGHFVLIAFCKASNHLGSLVQISVKNLAIRYLLQVTIAVKGQDKSIPHHFSIKFGLSLTFFITLSILI